MTPAEVLDRFREIELIRLVAYQNLYGPITGERLDIVAARLGMDIAAPHMKKNRRPKLRDHLIVWNRRAKARKTPTQMLAAVRGWQRHFEHTDRRADRARRRRAQQPADRG